MSSVQRFIRQIQPDNVFYKAADVVTAAAAGNVYEFTPDTGNVVGNYPPGVMTSSSVATNLATLIAQANNAASSNVVLRDMGKTVKAALSIAPTGQQYFFRQVQLISLATGALGGVQGGVNTPTNNSDYLTFYIPISVGGVPSVSLPQLAIACQM
jgi:hypothetical protein